MFLQIPTTQVGGLGFAWFADHVLDNSPVIVTRSQLLVAMKARDAITAAVDSVAELPDDVAAFWQRCCAEAPIPRLTGSLIGASGQPLPGGPITVPARAFDDFYLAVENMTAERPIKAAPEEAPAVAAE